MKTETLLIEKLSDEIRQSLADYVSKHYLTSHESTRTVYESLDGARKPIFAKTFHEAMLDSFKVFSKHDGIIHLVTDNDTVVGCSMGMRYMPSISPLSAEFFATVGQVCPEFFMIFGKTMPLTQAYRGLTDKVLAIPLEDKSLYYAGMSAYRDAEAQKALTEVLKQTVFQDTKYIGIYSLISDLFEAAIFENSGLQESPLATVIEAPELRLTLFHTGNPHIIELTALTAFIKEWDEEHLAEAGLLASQSEGFYQRVQEFFHGRRNRFLQDKDISSQIRLSGSSPIYAKHDEVLQETAVTQSVTAKK